MINPSSKVFAAGHLSVGVTTKNETLVFHSIMVDVRVTKTIIQLRALAITTARSRVWAKVSIHRIMLHVWFTEQKKKCFEIWETLV